MHFCLCVIPQDRALSKHCGNNVHIVANVLKHWALPAILGQIMTDIAFLVEKALLSGNLCIRIFLFCKSGRHRSMAVANILKHILSKSGPYAVSISHAERRGWGKLCTYCPDCLSLKPIQSALDDVARRFPAPVSQS